MGWAAAAASVAGSVISAVGAARAGQARADDAAARTRAALYQQQVALNNQIIANQNATYEENVGISQTEIQQMRTRANLSGLKTKTAASGVDVNTGSAVDVRQSMTELGQTDAANVMNRALKRAYGYHAQATDFGARAGMYGMAAAQGPREAAQAEEAAGFEVGKDLLSGFGTAAGAIGNAAGGGGGGGGGLTGVPGGPGIYANS